jgi:hypothetical protein
MANRNWDLEVVVLLKHIKIYYTPLEVSSSWSSLTLVDDYKAAY